ncbi:hypothetical protein [Pedobacter psychrophilus]|nr:hypothetical protein [Pedobacter psychrophilus]
MVWEKEIASLKLPIYYDCNFIESVSKVFNTEIQYFLFMKKNKALALGAFHVKNNKIITPESFTFTALWFSSQLSDVSYLEISDSLINIFKKKYRGATLRLETRINDIRPFIWADFKIENKYTYIKKDDLAPHYSVIKNLSKLENDHYIFKVEEIDEKSTHINLTFLKKTIFSNKLVDSYKLLLIEWDKIGALKAFSIYKQAELICSNIVLIDKNQFKVYTILLNSVTIEEKYAHTYLYSSIINWCKENGISEIDFCGANLPSVSKFKSYFNSELKTYFIVKYHPLRSNIYNTKESIVKLIKKIITRFRYS